MLSEFHGIAANVAIPISEVVYRQFGSLDIPGSILITVAEDRSRLGGRPEIHAAAAVAE